MWLCMALNRKCCHQKRAEGSATLDATLLPMWIKVWTMLLAAPNPCLRAMKEPAGSWKEKHRKGFGSVEAQGIASDPNATYNEAAVAEQGQGEPSTATTFQAAKCGQAYSFPIRAAPTQSLFIFCIQDRTASWISKPCASFLPFLCPFIRAGLIQFFHSFYARFLLFCPTLPPS